MTGTRLRIFAVAAVTVLTAPGRVLAAPVDRQAFVAGWPIELPADGRFFDVPISYEMYRYGRSIDEMAVLDQNGEPMPFYRIDATPPTVEEVRIALGVSPVFVRQGDGGGSDVTVATDGGRTRVSVRRDGQGATDLEVAAFVVDAQSNEMVPLAMELEWRPLDRPFLMRVTIEHSDTLTGWRTVGRGSNAALTIDGTTITHGRVPITGSSGGYYRISWDRPLTDWALERVSLIGSAQTETTTFASVDVPAFPASDATAVDNALYFDLGGAVPVSRIDLVFPEENSWANAGIDWSRSIDGPWRRASDRRLFYTVDYQDQPLTSSPTDVGRIEARYWRVTFLSAAPDDGTRLRVTYPLEKLRFSANGEPPYLLAGGTLSDEAGPDATFAQVVGALATDQIRAADARTGARIVLGGEGALVLPAPFPWQTVLLWIVLLAAGLTVGWMAVRLVREMSAKA